jgi:hypothetical protein
VVLASYLPERRPDASGTRAMIATLAFLAAGSTSSSGLSRNALRMICTLATCGRAVALRAWSTVSTLTPYAAIEPSSTSASRASYVASASMTSEGGQCSWTRCSWSMPRLRRDRSIHARKWPGR